MDSPHDLSITGETREQHNERIKKRIAIMQEIRQLASVFVRHLPESEWSETPQTLFLYRKSIRRNWRGKRIPYDKPYPVKVQTKLIDPDKKIFVTKTDMIVQRVYEYDSRRRETYDLGYCQQASIDVLTYDELKAIHRTLSEGIRLVEHD